MERYAYQQPRISGLLKIGFALAIACVVYNEGEKSGVRRGLALGEPREVNFLSMQYSHDYWGPENITGVEIRTDNERFIFLKDKKWDLFPATKELNVLDDLYLEKCQLSKKIGGVEEILDDKKHSLGEKND